MRVLVLGATSVLGTALLRAAPAQVPREAIQTVGRRPLADAPHETHAVADLLAPNVVEQLYAQSGPDVVFHLVGGRTARADALLETAIGVTVRLLRAVGGAGTRVVVAGCAEELGASDGRAGGLDEAAPVVPQSAWGHALAARTAAALAFQGARSVAVARLFDLVGPGLDNGAPADLARRIADAERRGGTVTLEGGDLVRDWVDVRDAAEALWKIASSGATGLFHVGSGKGTSLAELALELFCEAKGDCDLVPCGGALAENEVPRRVASIERVTLETGWSPRIALAQSAREMLEAARGMACGPGPAERGEA